MPIQHPTDRLLAALIDGQLPKASADGIRAHVRGCQRCELRAGAAGGSLLGADLPDFEPIPIAILEDSDSEVPDPGDVWRLAWDDLAALAVIWRTDVDRVSVLPVVDVADADEWSALLHPEVTGRLGDLAVSVALETTVPWSVLSACVTKLADTEAITSLRSAFRSGLPSTSKRGDTVRSPLDERLVGLEATAELFSDLANATWAPVPDAEIGITLAFEQLTDIGFAPNRALAISTHGASPSEAEADLIEAQIGIRFAAQAVDEALRRRIDQPSRKAAIRARALANRHSEGAERLALADLAHPALAAARGTHGAPPNYDLILDQLLDD